MNHINAGMGHTNLAKLARTVRESKWHQSQIPRTQFIPSSSCFVAAFIDASKVNLTVACLCLFEGIQRRGCMSVSMAFYTSHCITPHHNIRTLRFGTVTSGLKKNMACKKGVTFCLVQHVDATLTPLECRMGLLTLLRKLKRSDHVSGLVKMGVAPFTLVLYCSFYLKVSAPNVKYTVYSGCGSCQSA